MLRPVNKLSLIQEIVDQLKTLIFDGSLKPGDLLPSELELCNQLGVSRTAIREAKKVMIGMGLLESKRGEGTYIRNNTLDVLMDSLNAGMRINERMVEELTEARCIIEVAAAGLAARRASEADKKNLIDMLREMEIAKDQENVIWFRKLDMGWHEAVSEASQNRFIVKMSATTYSMLEDFMSAKFHIPGSVEHSYLGHKKVTDAIISGDEYAAQNAMRNHLEEALDILEHGREEKGEDKVMQI